MTPSEQFFLYLRAAIPFGYPIDSVPISLHMGDAHRKELMFQQFQFMELAETFFESAPWLSYIAAAKHFKVLDSINLTSAAFREISDKQYFSQLQQKASNVLSTCHARLDHETVACCDALISYQLNSEPLHDLSLILAEAKGAGIERFAPQPSELEADPANLGCIIFLGLVIIGFCYFNFTKNGNPDHDFFASLIAIGIVFVPQLILTFVLQERIKRHKAKKAQFEIFHGLKTRFTMLPDVIFEMLSVSKSVGLCNLAVMHDALEELHGYNNRLQAAYFDPYA